MAEPIAPPGAPLPLVASSRAAPDELRRAAEEFEAMFLGEMLRPMFEGLDTDGLGGGGIGEQIFRPMLVERYAEAIVRAGGVGVADNVVRELMRLQQTVPVAPERPDGVDR
jgi:Rod binding domain-containing protein